MAGYLMGLLWDPSAFSANEHGKHCEYQLTLEVEACMQHDQSLPGF
jgi:hypothetical protein